MNSSELFRAKFRKCALFAVLVSAFAPQQSRADVDVARVTVSKDHSYHQTVAGSTTQSSNPFFFGIEVVESSTNAITSANFTPPGGSSTAMTRDGSVFGPEVSFATQSALDSAFPNGTYAFTIQTVTAPLTYSPNVTLGATAYPNAPILSNTGWSGGFLQIDPTQAYLFTWNAPGGTEVGFTIDGIVSIVNLGANATSYLLPANSLVAGQDYVDAGTVYFRKSSSSSNDNGTNLGSVYTQDLGFSIHTVPEPASATLVVLAGSAVLALRRPRSV